MCPQQPPGRDTPLGNMCFRVEIDGMQGTGATEVIFPEGRLAPRKTGSSTQASVLYGPLILRKGLTASSEWYAWWDEARRPLRSRKKQGRTVRVTLLDTSGVSISGWQFTDVNPVAYQLSPLNALGNEPVFETLELSVGGFSAA
jgi:phage tail-like protein